MLVKLVSQGVPSATVPGNFDHAALSPDNVTVAMTKGNVLSIVNLSTSSSRSTTVPLPSRGLEFSSDGSKCILFGSSRADVVDAVTLKVLWGIAPPPSGANVIDSALSPDGNRWALLIMIGKISYIKTYNLGAQQELTLSATFPDTRAPMSVQLADKGLSPDANSVAISDRNTIAVWAIPSGKPIIPERKLPGSENIVAMALNSSYNKALLISTKSARVMDLSTGALGASIPLQQNPSNIALSPKGDTAAIAYPSGIVEVYSANGSKIRQLGRDGQPLRDLGFSADGKFVFALTNSGFHLWPQKMCEENPSRNGPNYLIT